MKKKETKFINLFLVLESQDLKGHNHIWSRAYP